jgi:hypothetical protein
MTGPATVIRAIEAGKAAARDIDAYLGFDHPISVDVDIPDQPLSNQPPWGRVNFGDRAPSDRRHDFSSFEEGFSAQDAAQESWRCLRCDKRGYGAFRGGRITQW